MQPSKTTKFTSTKGCSDYFQEKPLQKTVRQSRYSKSTSKRSIIFSIIIDKIVYSASHNLISSIHIYLLLHDARYRSNRSLPPAVTSFPNKISARPQSKQNWVMASPETVPQPFSLELPGDRSGILGDSPLAKSYVWSSMVTYFYDFFSVIIFSSFSSSSSFDKSRRAAI